jgi:hypothetical protein
LSLKSPSTHSLFPTSLPPYPLTTPLLLRPHSTRAPASARLHLLRAPAATHPPSPPLPPPPVPIFSSAVANRSHLLLHRRRASPASAGPSLLPLSLPPPLFPVATPTALPALRRRRPDMERNLEGGGDDTGITPPIQPSLHRMVSARHAKGV